jgi:hypothetical protein
MRRLLHTFYDSAAIVEQGFQPAEGFQPDSASSELKAQLQIEPPVVRRRLLRTVSARDTKRLESIRRTQETHRGRVVHVI